MKKNRTVYKGFIRVYKNKRGHETVKVTNSVAFLIFVTDLREVILVRQQRAAMVRPHNPRGLILETPAGRFDRKTGITSLIISEALEETGTRVAREDIELLNHGRPVALSPGVLTERTYLALVTVDASKVGQGKVFGAQAERERIRRVFVPVSKLKAMVLEDIKTMALVEHLLRKLEANDNATATNESARRPADD